MAMMDSMDLVKNAVRRKEVVRTSRKGREHTANYVRKVVNNLGKEMEVTVPENQVIIALLVGSRRCGKTTLMASMVRGFKAVLGRSLRITPVESRTEAEVDRCNKNLRRMAELPVTKIGVEPSTGISTYEFVIYHAEHPANVFLFRFIDVPGEWVKQRPEEMKLLADAADIFYLPLHSPAMIEENGKRNDEINAPSYIREIMQNKGMIKDATRPRLVLMVPQKCEKYFWQQFDSAGSAYAMQTVTEKAKSMYRGMFSHLMHGDAIYGQNCTIGILPILTVGGAQFDQFYEERDEEGHASLVEEYRMLITTHSSRKGFQPQLCEQPLLYTMRFLHEIVRRRHSGGKMGAFMRDMRNDGIGRAIKLAYHCPLLAVLHEATQIADFSGFTREDCRRAFSDQDGMGQRPLPQGIYVNQDVFGYEMIHDPYNLFTAPTPKAKPVSEEATKTA
ncbi:MAG: hypothetical protein LBM74_07475 [Oscillospiraceae bacterium]|jgi:hypothetical protein|nr:hypothetical protein [Oscillospiraceae bacterium]